MGNLFPVIGMGNQPEGFDVARKVQPPVEGVGLHASRRNGLLFFWNNLPLLPINREVNNPDGPAGNVAQADAKEHHLFGTSGSNADVLRRAEAQSGRAGARQGDDADNNRAQAPVDKREHDTQRQGDVGGKRIKTNTGKRCHQASNEGNGIRQYPENRPLFANCIHASSVSRNPTTEQLAGHYRDYGFALSVEDKEDGVTVLRVTEPPCRENLDVTLDLLVKATRAAGYRLISYIEVSPRSGVYLTAVAVRQDAGAAHE